MFKTCTFLSVKFAYSSNTACKSPDLRGNFQNAIAFVDSQTENKPVKAFTTISPGPVSISFIYRFLSVCKLIDCYHFSTALFQ